MKKLLPLLLCLALLLCACAGGGDQTPGAAERLPTVLDTNEYTLYLNLFYNGYADQLAGKTYTKTGTFTRLQDRYNGVERYYVWGYNDATKCCDWQWEFVPAPGTELPENGALVSMTGTLTADPAALDGYWYTDATLTVTTHYTGGGPEVDMGAMSATLERVQLLNLQYDAAGFEGRQVRLYGRVLDETHVQHPYYDEAWTQAFETDDPVPAIGTVVVLTGTWQGGVLTRCTVQTTDLY